MEDEEGRTYFKYERSTKNKFRYYECHKDGTAVELPDQQIGTLYISRSACGNEAPTMIWLEWKEYPQL